MSKSMKKTNQQKVEKKKRWQDQIVVRNGMMVEELDSRIWTQAGGKVNGQQDNWVHYEPEGWVETYFKLFIFKNSHAP